MLVYFLIAYNSEDMKDIQNCVMDQLSTTD